MTGNHYENYKLAINENYKIQTFEKCYKYA